jgi:hypothetical protein
LWLFVGPAAAAELPQIVILATGGTIAGQLASDVPRLARLLQLAGDGASGRENDDLGQLRRRGRPNEKPQSEKEREYTPLRLFHAHPHSFILPNRLPALISRDCLNDAGQRKTSLL